MKNWKFLLKQLSQRLWLRASLYAALEIAVALLAAAFSPFVPAAVAKPFGGGTVNSLLNVLAASLLAVATFSVAAMLTAYTNVSQGASPRAAALITGDSQAQSALATFVGAFLYSVVAFSANGTGYYGSGGRAIVFSVTLGVLAPVAINLLRWLDQLLSLARVAHTIARVEDATADAMKSPFGRPAPPDVEAPSGARCIYPRSIGYVQNVDLHALAKLAERYDQNIWVEASPGAFAEPSRVLARVTGEVSDQCEAEIEGAFAIGQERSFSQDTRFGFIVLGQIASKALSPGLNDPGTAIDVAASAVRLLKDWLQPEVRHSRQPAARVTVSRPAFEDLLRDVFEPMALDGSSSLLVSMRLQRALRALRHIGDTQDQPAIRRLSRESIHCSDKAMDFDFDRARVRAGAGYLLA